jgi:hypothetical protein
VAVLVLAGEGKHGAYELPSLCKGKEFLGLLARGYFLGACSNSERSVFAILIRIPKITLTPKFSESNPRFNTATAILAMICGQRPKSFFVKQEAMAHCTRTILLTSITHAREKYLGKESAASF